MTLMLLPLLASLCSCFGLARVQYSEPVTDDPRVSLRKVREWGRMFVMGDVIFNVDPSNDVRHPVLLFPIPLDGGKTVPEGPTFTVGVYLWSETEELQLDVNEIEFWRERGTRLTATSFLGPFDCAASPTAEELRPHAARTLQLKRGVCNFVWVKFDTTPPDPKEPFWMKISGVSAGGRDIDLPGVAFRAARKTESIALP